jgi:hypothetical protein
MTASVFTTSQILHRNSGQQRLSRDAVADIPDGLDGERAKLRAKALDIDVDDVRAGVE